MIDKQLDDHLKWLEEYCTEHKLPYILGIMLTQDDLLASYNLPDNSDNRLFEVKHILEYGERGFVTVKHKSQKDFEELQSQILDIFNDILAQDIDLKTKAKINQLLKEMILPTITPKFL